MMTTPTTTRKPLEFQVFNTSVTSMHANMTIIKGETDAVLVDVPFSRADSHRVVAEILDSGKTLRAIIISHDHPDHFFGLDVLSDAFPDVPLYAHSTVVRDMTKSVPLKFDRWGDMLGTNRPLRQVIPHAIPEGGLEIEGRKLEIIGPMQGDHVHQTVIWEAESATLIASDLLFNGVYVFLGEHLPPQYDDWLESLDRMEAMRPRRIIAGHTRPGLPDDSFAIDWTRGYIKAFRDAALRCKTSGELADTMHALYPHAVDVAGGFLVGVSARVGVGEIPPWDE